MSTPAPLSAGETIETEMKTLMAELEQVAIRVRGFAELIEQRKRELSAGQALMTDDLVALSRDLTEAYQAVQSKITVLRAKRLALRDHNGAAWPGI